MEFLDLPNRTLKNRLYGITSIADFGTPIGELRNILNDFHQFIDIAKIGIGCAYVTPNIEEKIKLYKEYNIKPYFGGTLFEKCYYQQRLDEYVSKLKILGIEWIEVSNGTLDISLKERLTLINKLKKEFYVLGEVGSKDAEKDLPISEWKDEINLLLDAGCKYVITEGRDSGTAGIYDRNGKVKDKLIEEMTKNVDINRVIFEAPTPKNQMFFINSFGANVNLGNVKLQDALVLEAQRRGLRSETFYLEDIQCKSPL
ncbi:phosphosulfolactate synthase [Litchfieldia salsa]|uniref:Phosphosulfolactate synthase n=1 Tax=Litchfieldia salsa TaxID=930152 RepID=A0A1H0TGA7_9BACI|nr:phosphosulfolactate synthase [Litchfieldia salsa]SDP52851.1 phosphosulfolactate synthase [Litchfieldia salsa]